MISGLEGGQSQWLESWRVPFHQSPLSLTTQKVEDAALGDQAPSGFPGLSSSAVLMLEGQRNGLLRETECAGREIRSARDPSLPPTLCPDFSECPLAQVHQGALLKRSQLPGVSLGFLFP